MSTVPPPPLRTLGDREGLLPTEGTPEPRLVWQDLRSHSATELEDQRDERKRLQQTSQNLARNT